MIINVYIDRILYWSTIPVIHTYNLGELYGRITGML